jgi:galactokinase
VVCASALLFAAHDANRLQLAEAAAAAERYVGTQSGGMDQAASLLGTADHALLLQFRPLRAETVPVPKALAIVVADSGVRAEKGGAAQQAYNQRVQQCLLAASAMGALPGGLLADVPGVRRAERARALPDALLARRAGFVFAEAERVIAAVAALRAGDLQGLGALVDASHRGLRDDYEVSHPAVDALVEVARRHGALGARIVGAGFGGCAIALCRSEKAAAMQKALQQAGALSAFAVQPSAGARQRQR